ncbi:hypothetical protein DL96DRAFT_1580872 [Flagelloscypha sp. PMI_526]|nr:hypothetical protein DL96DRAFT_1580872 [Flagelloscypha sp. PMI_526]
MASLPLDLLPQLLHSLDAPDLDICCLVTRDFYRVARQVFFTHLVLTSRTWRAKCRLLLSDRGSQFVANIRNLTIQLLQMPLFLADEELPSNLVSLLERWSGPACSIYSFCLEAVPEYSYTRSLHVLGLFSIPLHTVLGYCTILLSLHLSAKVEEIPRDLLDGDTTPTSFSTEIRSLLFGSFGQSDFSQRRTLAPFLQMNGTRIHSLELGYYCHPHFPVTLNFLASYHSITNWLVHLSFGSFLFNTVTVEATTGIEKTVLPPLGINHFPQLERLSLAHDSGRWDSLWHIWFEWIALTLDPSSSNIPRSFKCLEFIQQLDEGPRPRSAALDNLAASTNFDIHGIVMVRRKVSPQRLEETISAFRSFLPSWHHAGKLKFWVRQRKVAIKYLYS